jgi:hypothetical protein
MKNFRNPYLSMVMAVVVLFVSCEQDVVTEVETINKFDYSAFNQFKKSNVFDVVITKIEKGELQKTSNSAFERNKNVLDLVNLELGTSLVLPEKLLTLSVEMTAGDIYATSLNNGWLSESDVELAKGLSGDIQLKGVEIAVKHYENKILSMNLSNEEFLKHNLIVNTVKSLNYEYPNLFKEVSFNNKTKSWWRCGLAALALTVAIGNMSTCATIVACGVATLLLVNAGYAVADQC